MSRPHFRYNPFFCKPTIAVDQKRESHLLVMDENGSDLLPHEG